MLSTIKQISAVSCIQEVEEMAESAEAWLMTTKYTPNHYWTTTEEIESIIGPANGEYI
jgi:hypothetical protein